MTFTISEQILAHISFFILFIVTVIFWVKFIYMNNKTLNIFGKIGMIIAFLFITIFLLARWIISKHFPLSNLYESSMFLSWGLTLIHLIVESKSKNSWLGIITAPSAMLAHGFATLGLPREMQQSLPLVPALQSHWLMMHVTTMILSYSALLCGSLLAIVLWIIAATKQKNFSLIKYHTNPFFNYIISKDYSKIISNNTYYESRKSLCFINFRKWQLINKLDNYSYRIISFGFPLLTIGILSGAVWANEAWGSYWNWDPKETWALITWLVFAIYLHTRMIIGWRMKQSALIASSGFFIIWICYLGVNLLGKGLHSYGWLL
uniref:Cytochrome c biogenesis protein CcsA n=1 Tax=Ptilidium pulcherrimum TaxID=3143427 RepID=F5GV47_9MARC|nr:cytochrome c heme attachment protein [Ptilidium ciliare var. pulcherrimum]ADK89649.1 cytochrome c heme attachment protein [Ptilidium ciliare var. pulcherrimum]